MIVGVGVGVGFPAPGGGAAAPAPQDPPEPQDSGSAVYWDGGSTAVQFDGASREHALDVRWDAVA